VTFLPILCNFSKVCSATQFYVMGHSGMWYTFMDTWGPVCPFSLLTTPNPADRYIHRCGLFTSSILYQSIKTPCTHVLFLVESNTQITQFLIHLNLTLKLNPCIDTTHFTCIFLLSICPKIRVHVNLTSRHQVLTWSKHKNIASNAIHFCWDLFELSAKASRPSCQSRKVLLRATIDEMVSDYNIYPALLGRRYMESVQSAWS
jgi:hypothetical protein